MKRILALAFLYGLLPLAGLATSYTFNGGGALWGTATNWTPNGVPGGLITDTDTVSIPDGTVVTINQPIWIGISGVNGTTAINLNNSGRLILSGGPLTLRGNIFYISNGCANKLNSVVMTAGSSLVFDSSLAISPSTTHYQITSDGGDACRPFFSSGNAGSHNTITSNLAGGAGAGQFAGFGGGANLGGAFIATYTDISKMGDASNFGFSIFFRGNKNTGNGNPITWNVTHSTFDHCGVILSESTAGVNTTGVMDHQYNVHTNSVGPGIFSNWGAEGATGGERTIRNNVFDIPFTADFFNTSNYTFWLNYFGDAAAFPINTAWDSWQGNFIRRSMWNLAPMGAFAGLTDTYMFLDSDGGNVRFASNGSTSADLIGIIFGQGGTGHAPPGVEDSAELWPSNLAFSPATLGVYNSIILPNMNGFGSTEIGSPTLASLAVAKAEHNTYFGGFSTGVPTVSTNGYGAYDLEEDNATPAGTINSFRSNILWNPALTVDSQGNPFNYQSAFYKVIDIFTGTVTTDVCSPTACDYNSGYNYTATYPNGQFTNQADGYAAKFSSTPGLHDVNGDPKFVDYQRSVELWDSKYLGNNPSAWNSGATYSVGDMVQRRLQNVYWALPVNYRYTNSGTCNGRNVDPNPIRLNVVAGAVTTTGSSSITCGGGALCDKTILTNGTSIYFYFPGNQLTYQFTVVATTGCSGNMCTGVTLNTPYTGPNDMGFSTAMGQIGTAVARECWEWASLYRIRQAVAAGTVYEDISIGASNFDVIMTLLSWIRTGYSPTNKKLAGAAHDGTDIGCCSVSILGGASPPPPASSGAAVRKGIVRKGGVR